MGADSWQQVVGEYAGKALGEILASLDEMFPTDDNFALAAKIHYEVPAEAMTTYTVYGRNDQGAATNVGIDMDHPNGGKPFTSIRGAETAARNELAAGWRVHIIDDHGEEVKTFTIRK